MISQETHGDEGDYADYGDEKEKKNPPSGIDVGIGFNKTDQKAVGSPGDTLDQVFHFLKEIIPVSALPPRINTPVEVGCQGKSPR
jgi:hypothetical protein